MLLTFLLVVFGWIVFRAESIRDAWQYVCRVFSSSLFTSPDASGVTGFSVAILIMIIVEWIQRHKEHALDLSEVRAGVLRYIIYITVLFLTFSLGGHEENFIYFQF